LSNDVRLREIKTMTTTGPGWSKKTAELEKWAQLHREWGIDSGLFVKSMNEALEHMRQWAMQLEPDPELRKLEPDDLEDIRSLRPDGPRSLVPLDQLEDYPNRLAGAFIARSAGCTLGAIVEGWSVEKMQRWAAHLDIDFPPTDYWPAAHQPDLPRYGISPCHLYTRDGMDGIPVDDDLVYTVLGLLIAEKHGLGFTTEQLGHAWLDYLPHACTAEKVALANLSNGVDWDKCGEIDNPYLEWIGAQIRADAWGYLAPGQPEKAAAMAYRDAYISHRRNGIYGEMLFAAAIAAAFAVDDPLEAIRIGLTEIPADCRLAEAVRWSLKVEITDWQHAAHLVRERFPDMHVVHTINNACLVVFGLRLGGRDVTKALGETVAMGLDNDCTAATVGSVLGAVVGSGAIPQHWSARFHNEIHTYINGHLELDIEDLLSRFQRLALNQK
jgi:ADP-ribosylglycohydrolase